MCLNISVSILICDMLFCLLDVNYLFVDSYYLHGVKGSFVALLNQQ